MNFKELPSSPCNGGIQYVAIFPNGYGASIVQHPFSYGGNKGKWELAVLCNISGKPFDRGFKFELCYSTPITDDVLGYLSEFEVNETLDEIEKLK